MGTAAPSANVAACAIELSTGLTDAEVTFSDDVAAARGLASTRFDVSRVFRAVKDQRPPTRASPATQMPMALALRNAGRVGPNAEIAATAVAPRRRRNPLRTRAESASVGMLACFVASTRALRAGLMFDIVTLASAFG